MRRRTPRILLAVAALLIAVTVVFGIAEMNGRLPREPSRPPAFVALGGACFLCFAATFVAFVLPHRLRGQRTAGRVTALRQDVDDGNFPVVRYTVDAVEYEFRSPVFARLKVGDAVPMTYLPENPADGWIDGWAQVYLIPLLFGGAGTVMVMVGAGTFVR